jgi:hypothetical protein
LLIKIGKYIFRDLYILYKLKKLGGHKMLSNNKRKKSIFLTAIFLLAISGLNPANTENEEIKKVIQDALVDGYLNYYDIEEMQKGIHSDFQIMELRNNELSKRGFNALLDYVKKVKPSRPEGRRVKVTVKFLMVDVIGTIGCAKVEFYVGSTLHGTDFITLMKFEEGWKMVGSVAYEHEKH